MKTYTLFALDKHETRPYMETFLCEVQTPEQLEKVREMAKEQGFHSFRQSTIEMNTVPNFTGTINK
jgi:hypothetical protein